MPIGVVKTPEDERHWAEAKVAVAKQYGMAVGKGARYWRLVMGVFKRMTGGTGSSKVALVKSHVRGHLRHLPSGKVAVVVSHEDKRVAAQKPTPTFTEKRVTPKGNVQYLYTAEETAARAAEKFERVTAFSNALPKLLRKVKGDLALSDTPQEKVAATVVALMDRCHFRIGTEEYAEAHGTYGVTTLKPEHVEVKGSTIRFRFMGKKQVAWDRKVTDKHLAEFVGGLASAGHEHLFWYNSPRGPQPLSAGHVNKYLEGFGVTAKDLRTYHASRLCGESLKARSASEGETLPAKAVKSAVREAVAETAKQLGNTPAVCKGSYIMPAIIEDFVASGGRLTTPQLGKSKPVKKGLATTTLDLTDSDRWFAAYLDALAARHRSKRPGAFVDVARLQKAHQIWVATHSRRGRAIPGYYRVDPRDPAVEEGHGHTPADRTWAGGYQLTVQGKQLVLSSPYNEALIKEYRKLTGAAWDKSRRVWTFPAAAYGPLIALVAKVTAPAEAAWKACENWEAGPYKISRLKSCTIALESPYDADLVKRIKAIPGAEWLVEQKRWKFPPEQYAKVRALAEEVAAKHEVAEQQKGERETAESPIKSDTLDANDPAVLPTLQGSEKQVAWAESIRADLLADLSELGRAAPGREAIVETLKATIREERRASWWIDHQNNTGEMLIEEVWRSTPEGQAAVVEIARKKVEAEASKVAEAEQGLQRAQAAAETEYGAERVARVLSRKESPRSESFKLLMLSEAMRALQRTREDHAMAVRALEWATTAKAGKVRKAVQAAVTGVTTTPDPSGELCWTPDGAPVVLRDAAPPRNLVCVFTKGRVKASYHSDPRTAKRVYQPGYTTKRVVKVRPQAPVTDQDRVHDIPLATVRPDPRQHRKDFDARYIKELAESINTSGQKTPIVIRPVTPEGAVKYQIIAGECRYRAAKQAGIKTIRAFVRNNVTDEEALTEQVIENLARKQVNATEEGSAYRQLADMEIKRIKRRKDWQGVDFASPEMQDTLEGLGRKYAAAQTGKPKARVDYYVVLTDLPDEVKAMVDKGGLSPAHAHALLRLTDPHDDARLWEDGRLRRERALHLVRMARHAQANSQITARILGGMVVEYIRAQQQQTMFTDEETGRTELQVKRMEQKAKVTKVLDAVVDAINAVWSDKANEFNVDALTSGDLQVNLGKIEGAIETFGNMRAIVEREMMKREAGEATKRRVHVGGGVPGEGDALQGMPAKLVGMSLFKHLLSACQAQGRATDAIAATAEGPRE